MAATAVNAVNSSHRFDDAIGQCVEHVENERLLRGLINKDAGK